MANGQSSLRGRSAGSGRFIPVDTVRSWPNTSTVERVPKPGFGEHSSSRRGRDASTGEFVTTREAELRPAVTVVERVPDPVVAERIMPDVLGEEFSGLPELLKLFAPILGADGVSRMAALLADPRIMQALTTPATLVRDLRDAMEAIFDSRSEPDEDEIVNWMLDSMAMFRDAGHDIIKGEKETFGAGTGGAVYALMSYACAVAGREAVIKAIRGVALRLSMRAVYAMAALARAASDNPDGFEEGVRRTASAVKEAVELWYVPLLNLVHECYLLSMGRGSAGKYVEFGEVTKFLKAADLGELLDDDIRIVRHADAHGGIDPDVERGEVSFVNRTRKGTQEVLGPWRIDDVRRCAYTFWLRCVAMSLTIVAWTVDAIEPSVAPMRVADGT